jgi:hypothetical protein
MTTSWASTSQHPHPSSGQHAHPVPHCVNSEVIPCSHISTNSSYPIQSSSQQLTIPVHVPDSRRHLTPTASNSAPPPPIIDTELQHNSDDDIVPLPKQLVVDPSPVEDKVMAQPAMKRKGKARAKAVMPQQTEAAEPLGPDVHDAPLPAQRSARAGQKSKSRVP